MEDTNKTLSSRATQGTISSPFLLCLAQDTFLGPPPGSSTPGTNLHPKYGQLSIVRQDWCLIFAVKSISLAEMEARRRQGHVTTMMTSTSLATNMKTVILIKWEEEAKEEEDGKMVVKLQKVKKKTYLNQRLRYLSLNRYWRLPYSED